MKKNLSDELNLCIRATLSATNAWKREGIAFISFIQQRTTVESDQYVIFEKLIFKELLTFSNSCTKTKAAHNSNLGIVNVFKDETLPFEHSNAIYSFPLEY